MGLDNPLHIAFLVLILLLVFGARRLPEIGRSLGSGMREFKQSITGESGQQSAQGAAQQPTAIAPAAETAPPGLTPAPPAQTPAEPAAPVGAEPVAAPAASSEQTPARDQQRS